MVPRAVAIEVGLPLPVVVTEGGRIGSLLALKCLPQTWIRWATAALTIWVGGRLLLGL
jgi:uncharacterized membrane protein YfcA